MTMRTESLPHSHLCFVWRDTTRLLQPDDVAHTRAFRCLLHKMFCNNTARHVADGPDGVVRTTCRLKLRVNLMGSRSPPVSTSSRIMEASPLAPRQARRAAGRGDHPANSQLREYTVTEDEPRAEMTDAPCARRLARTHRCARRAQPCRSGAFQPVDSSKDACRRGISQ